MKNAEQSAFPISSDHGYQGLDCIGLTKREYFAGLAMQGLVFKLNSDSDHTDLVRLAKSAVIVSDELLKQLES